MRKLRIYLSIVDSARCYSRVPNRSIGWFSVKGIEEEAYRCEPVELGGLDLLSLLFIDKNHKTEVA
jgi:hypothetical protein